jgi:AraC family transcriptional regulator
MMAEVKEGCPSGAIYAQSLSMALAAYLAGRFSLTTREKKRQQFSEAQSRLLLDYIQAQLNHDLNLLDLARLVGLCPRQLVRLFSNTFGTTPHRYIVNKRVALAKALLARGLLIFEVMHATGFTSQSHFTNVFRKVTGTSPGRFRQEHRPSIIAGAKAQ